MATNPEFGLGTSHCPSRVGPGDSSPRRRSALRLPPIATTAGCQGMHADVRTRRETTSLIHTVALLVDAPGVAADRTRRYRRARMSPHPPKSRREPQFPRGCASHCSATIPSTGNARSFLPLGSIVHSLSLLYTIRLPSRRQSPVCGAVSLPPSLPQMMNARPEFISRISRPASTPQTTRFPSALHRGLNSSFP